MKAHHCWQAKRARCRRLHFGRACSRAEEAMSGSETGEAGANVRTQHRRRDGPDGNGRMADRSSRSYSQSCLGLEVVTISTGHPATRRGAADGEARTSSTKLPPTDDALWTLRRGEAAAAGPGRERVWREAREQVQRRQRQRNDASVCWSMMLSSSPSSVWPHLVPC